LAAAANARSISYVQVLSSSLGLRVRSLTIFISLSLQSPFFDQQQTTDVYLLQVRYQRRLHRPGSLFHVHRVRPELYQPERLVMSDQVSFDFRTAQGKRKADHGKIAYLVGASLATPVTSTRTVSLPRNAPPLGGIEPVLPSESRVSAPGSSLPL
jgi:hypothetical protein